jgi:hypothetical protein
MTNGSAMIQLSPLDRWGASTRASRLAPHFCPLWPGDSGFGSVRPA